MSRTFQALLRQTPQVSRDMISGAGTQHSHRSHPKTRVTPAELLYIIIHVNLFLHLEDRSAATTTYQGVRIEAAL
jgi:hypothetical protein